MPETTTFSSGNDEVIALAKMISEATDKIVKIYTAAGAKIPRLNSTEVGPFDSVGKIPAELLRELRILEAACGQLNATINSPPHVATSRAYLYVEPTLLQFITSIKVADHLLDKPNGLHAKELAAKAGVDSDKLARILRYLTNKHVFQEIEPDVFAHNRLSLQLVSTNPISGLIGHITYEAFRASSYLTENLKDPATAFSLSADDSVFKRAWGTSVFGFYETPHGKLIADRFAQAMVGWGEVTGIVHQLPLAYPWSSVPEGSTFCDVGGGNGHVSCELIKKASNLRVIIQDLPPVIEQAKQFWNEEYPEAVSKQRVEFVALDFFKESPIPNCRFYFLRHVLHDWPYAECIKILQNIRKVMSESSSLFINELVLQSGIRSYDENNAVEQAPEPLLPNYGMARLRLYEQDMNMMMGFNSKERTLQEFVDMGAEAGLKFKKVWDAGATSIVELVVA